MLRRRSFTVLALAIVVAACGDDTGSAPTTTADTPVTSTVADSAPHDDPDDPGVEAPIEVGYANALRDLSAAVDRWAAAGSIGDARAAAEEVANLVVGVDGPGFGDRDGSGSTAGSVDRGLLPGIDGRPSGLALDLQTTHARYPDLCVDAEVLQRDVLGGDWSDPADRYRIMEEAIDAWTPSGNTMPSLPSHPMRVVGWATFTLALDPDAPDALATAHEYAGHARIHVDVAKNALDCA